MQATILTENELRSLIHIDDAVIDAIEAGFTALSSGKVSMPPIMRLDIPEKNAEVDVKTAYVRGLDSFAVKMSPGFFDNHKIGLPSTSGLMILLSAENGFVKAVLLDNGYLTDVRTGAAGAVAARHLAPQTVKTAGVIGAGAQARFQMIALRQVRRFEKLLVYNRSVERAAQYADEMKQVLGVPVYLADSAQEVVESSDVVVTTTPSHDAYVQAEWLHAGLHITAMGSDAEDKNEIDPRALASATTLICDSRVQCARLGELHHAVAAGVMTTDDSRIIELGEITGGKRKGRAAESDITICDLTGTGMQDTVIASAVHKQAVEANLGFSLTLR
jgi:ornithine cyclodeaminase